MFGNKSAVIWNCPAMLLLGAMACFSPLGRIQAQARRGKPSTLLGILEESGSPHEWTVTFVHRIKNKTQAPLRQVEVAIALPRSDERQTVHALKLMPEPSRLSEDGWEQETAHFVIDRVPPGSEAEIRIEISVTLHDLEWLVTERDVGEPAEIPERIARHYLRNGENYRLDKEVVQRTASRIESSSCGLLEKLRRIHDLVIDSIEYKRDDRWDAADRVLGQGTGSCSEYSYLMIAICRLNGIPARYAGGTWLEQDGECPPRSPGRDTSEHVDRVFHRWVEVYLPRIGWFPIDPTQDDRAEKKGEPYRYFGRLPWSYLALTHGDGDQLESGLLGWEYRSSMKWLGQPHTALPKDVIIDRYAIWKQAGESAATGLVGN